MIYSMGEMEYFDNCEITPNMRCSNCMTHWPKGIVYCTCGTCSRPSDKVRKLNRYRFDVLSIPNYIIKKGPSHGRRHGNTQRQRTNHQAHVSSRKAKKEDYTSIQDWFLRCLIHRQSQLDIGWTEGHCARLDEVAAEDLSYIATAAERARRANTCVLVLNSSGPNRPINQREDHQEAKSSRERLHQESGQAHHILLPQKASSSATRPAICLARRRFGAPSTQRQAWSGTTFS